MAGVGRLAGHGGRLGEARALYPHAPEPWIDLSTGINPEPYADVRASAAARARLPMPQETRALELAAGRAFGVEDADRVAAAAGSEAVLRLMPYVLGLMAHVSGSRPDAPGSMAHVFRPGPDAPGSMAHVFGPEPDTPGSMAHVFGPGSDALRLQAAVVVGPTYSSHSAAWRAAGVQSSEISDAMGLGASSGTPLVSSDTARAPFRRQVGLGAPVPWVLTVVNPNNPDGRVVDRERLLEVHDEVAAQSGYLVVDEAFADVEPDCSVAALAGSSRYARLIVLRSFGKFYGLAGVRLGFVIAGAPVIARFRDLLGDWPVSADAIAVGLAAYADHSWAERTRERLRHAANRLDDLLIRSGLEIIGGTSLFRLARNPDARARFENLLRAGILVRPFDHDPALLRFGLPHEPSAWRRLAEGLKPPIPQVLRQPLPQASGQR